MSESVWTAPWQRLRETAILAYATAIEVEPARFRGHVERFLSTLNQARASLDHIRQLAIADPRIGPLETRYAVLRTGLLQKTARFDGPPLLVIAGIGLSLAAIAWSIAAYQYAAHLREHTALLEKELLARVEASRQGRVLQDSTLGPTTRRMGWVLLGGLVIGAVGLAWHGRHR